MIRRNETIWDRLSTSLLKNGDLRLLSASFFTGFCPTLDRHAGHFVSYLYDLLSWRTVLYFEKASHCTDRPSSRTTDLNSFVHSSKRTVHYFQRTTLMRTVRHQNDAPQQLRSFLQRTVHFLKAQYAVRTVRPRSSGINHARVSLRLSDGPPFLKG